MWFKGGTSLSKGFALIERFSEDLASTHFATLALLLSENRAPRISGTTLPVPPGAPGHNPGLEVGWWGSMVAPAHPIWGELPPSFTLALRPG
jgi:hypothetical protein